MSEKELLAQLLGMVAKMHEDVKAIKQDIELIKNHIVDNSESINYLVHKTAEHELDLHKLKKRLID